MNWIPTNERLPREGQAVLVRRANDNWHLRHSLAGGEVRDVWRWQAAQFRLREPHGNDHTGYEWKGFGPGCLFGHEVSHWCAIEEPA